MISYILIIICIVFSFIFSGSEIAFSASSEIKLRKAKENKKKFSNITYNIFEKFDTALVTILIGNNLVNISSSSIATVIAIALMGEKGAPIASAIMTIIIIIFGEITPKVIANKAPEKFARTFASIIYVLMIITKPIVIVVNALIKLLSKLWKNDKVTDEVTESDLETIIDTVEEEGVVDEDTADLLQNAMDFDGVYAYEIITHRMDVDGIDIEDSVDVIKEKIKKTIYSRLPVYKASLDDTIGYIIVDECLKEMINGTFVLDKMIRKPLYVYKTTLLDDVLNQMREANTHIAIVTDEYGGSMGIVTMEDVLEQIVGEIWDEKDIIEDDFEKVRKNTYIVQGDMRIEDMFDELDFEDDEFESDNATVGGWAIEMLGEYPKVGDSFDYKNLHFTITEVDDFRVNELKVLVKEIKDDEK